MACTQGLLDVHVASVQGNVLMLYRGLFLEEKDLGRIAIYPAERW